MRYISKHLLLAVCMMFLPCYAYAQENTVIPKDKVKAKDYFKKACLNKEQRGC